MDCTCPKAFRISFFFLLLQAGRLPGFSSVLSPVDCTSLSLSLSPPFSCFCVCACRPSHSLSLSLHSGYILRLKSKRFYIVIVIIATHTHTPHTRTPTHIRACFICTCIYLLMAYFCLFMYSYAMSKIIVNMLIKYAPATECALS